MHAKIRGDCNLRSISSSGSSFCKVIVDPTKTYYMHSRTKERVVACHTSPRSYRSLREAVVAAAAVAVANENTTKAKPTVDRIDQRANGKRERFER